MLSQARLRVRTLVLLLVCLCSTLSCSSFESRTPYAIHGFAVPNMHSVEELHASLRREPSYYGLGQFRALQVGRIPLIRQQKENFFAYTDLDYTFNKSNGLPLQLNYRRILISPRANMKTPTQCILRQMAIVHELAHLYMAQRYYFISLRNDDTSFIIREGHAQWMQYHWAARHVSPAAARIIKSTSPAYRRAHAEFVRRYTEGGRGQRILWERIAAHEMALAPKGAGYRISNIPINYPL